MKTILSPIITAMVMTPFTCGSFENGDIPIPHAVRTSGTPSGTPSSTTTTSFLLKELGSACTNGGGSFDGVDCDCGNALFDADARACVARPNWFYNANCARETGNARNSCIRVGLFFHGATTVSIVPPTNAASEMIDDLLEDVAPKLQPRIPPTPSDGSGATIVVTVADTPQFGGDQIKNAFDNQLYHHQTGDIISRKGYVYLQAASIDDLAITLDSKDDAGDTYNGTLLPVWSGDSLLSELANATSQALDRDKVKRIQPRSTSSIGGSCLDACTIERLITTTSTGRQAVVVDRYVGGIRQNRELRLLSPKHQIIEAKVVFDFSDRPNLAYIPAIVHDGGKLITRVRVLDQYLSEVATSDFELLGNETFLTEFKQDASLSVAKNETPIISFETGYSFQSPETFAWALRGPFADFFPESRKSLVGWYPLETAGALEYARGFIPSYEESPFADRVSGDHPYVVNQILTGHGDFLHNGTFRSTRIIPLGSAIFSPMTATAVRRAMRSDYRTHVGSLSVANSMDLAACTKNMSTLLSTGLLLAVAAGNDRSDIAETDLCPQRLAPSPNLIVVGAAQYNRMESYSNYGEKFVDIAADGSTHEHAPGGTSFAAPRVAYTTAQLAADPEILALGIAPTNAQIRMALLLSAELPPNGELPVRCGGSLTSDYTRARLALINLLQVDPEKTAFMQDKVPLSKAYAIAKLIKQGNPENRVRILIRNQAVCVDDGVESSCDPSDAPCAELVTFAGMHSSACHF